jgi:hypothetical protein
MKLSLHFSHLMGLLSSMALRGLPPRFWLLFWFCRSRRIAALAPLPPPIVIKNNAEEGNMQAKKKNEKCSKDD